MYAWKRRPSVSPLIAQGGGGIKKSRQSLERRFGPHDPAPRQNNGCDQICDQIWAGELVYDRLQAPIRQVRIYLGRSSGLMPEEELYRPEIPDLEQEREILKKPWPSSPDTPRPVVELTSSRCHRHVGMRTVSSDQEPAMLRPSNQFYGSSRIVASELPCHTVHRWLLIVLPSPRGFQTGLARLRSERPRNCPVSSPARRSGAVLLLAGIFP